MADVLESTWCSWDGSKLFYRAWLPPDEVKRGVIIFHRGHEHSGRVAPLADALAAPHTAVFAPDLRGQGRNMVPSSTHEVNSTESRLGKADAKSLGFADLLGDVESFVSHIAQTHAIGVHNLCVVGHGLSSVVVCTWIHDLAPPIRGLILVTPGFRVKLRLPFAFETLRFALHFFDDISLPTLMSGRMLTRDPGEATLYEHDPLVRHTLSARLLVEMHEAARRVVDDAAAITIPTMVLTAQRDRVVEPGLQAKFSSSLSSSHKSHHRLPKARHDPLHDSSRDEAVAIVRDFVSNCFEWASSDEAALRRVEDCSWTTLEEWPGGGPHHAVLRFLLKTVGRLSGGIRIGLSRGFDSGECVDYAYCNEVHGATPIGRLLDRLYLNAPGWRAMRVRQMHLAQLLERAIQMCREQGLVPRVLDVACGSARHVLHVLRKHPDVEAWLCDIDDATLASARTLADTWRVPGAHFVRANAFDPAALSSAAPVSPSIAIASGLYEMFPRNTAVHTSLQAIAQVMGTQGMLLYTNQPWHPHLRFVTNVLPNRLGRPWRMRCRSQVEMDHLVADAGFEKIATMADDYPDEISQEISSAR